MVIELYKNPGITLVYIQKNHESYKPILQKSGFIPVSVTDIRDWELMIEQLGIVPLYTDMKYLYGYDGWFDGETGEYIRFRKIAEVIPSIKYDLGTRTIELTDAEIFCLKEQFRNADLLEDIRYKIEELQENEELAADLHLEPESIAELVECRKTCDFGYSDSYWRLIEESIFEHAEEVQYERPE